MSHLMKGLRTCRMDERNVEVKSIMLLMFVMDEMCYSRRGVVL